ncbi:FAD-dependent oxidoreductase [Phragmitibacter flavus]|uniref:FAD-dependent oxidoreductase n=1 Tax=Phragmitibacter flavus TaxID=2576071 RepID=A0A5R8KHJ6_9BACT|nr:FAD-dependent oxidoreductase [Phragmitibacter flavus]TLD71752.1 FAD-dependent oxidoreductase [Phragmitibacter flavus]
MKKSLLALSLFAAFQAQAATATATSKFVEAESFGEHGGWVLDTQFIEIMGSPYLMAHGLGKPVEDASATVKSPGAGEFKVWVRTKNWVGPWDAPGAPGRFQVSVNGEKLAKEFGAEGKDWLWEDGGTVTLKDGDLKLALHDLTGFNGRVDAIYLTSDLNAAPPVEKAALAKFRHEQLGLPAEPPVTKEYDLVVVGGGYGGLGAAISAARQGLKVALIQNRGVLGGNGSSEVQVWAMGGTRRGLYPHLGEIVEEFADRASNSPGRIEEYGDELKEKVVRAEKNIDLFLFHHVWKVEMKEEKGAKKIAAVIALDVKNSTEKKIPGKFFSDCTGHGTLGAMAEASYTMALKGHLGMSNMWVIHKKEASQEWPETPWALQLTPEDFPEPHAMKPQKASGNQRNMEGYQTVDLSKLDHENFLKGEWFWESGFDKHPIEELELVRDWNLRAVFGAFSTMRKTNPEKYKNYSFDWLAYIGGTRESRLIQGDLVLTEKDVIAGKQFPDGCVPTTWDLDLHYPREQFMKTYPENPFISRAVFGEGIDRRVGYPVPYRCFYSKDIENMFMAGRQISVDRGALGSTRVMRTIGMMGEVVGKAAYLSVRHETTPRGVYEQYLDNLKELMSQPGAMRRDGIESPLYLPEGAVKLPPVVMDFIPLDKLEGLVIDDSEAELTGTWTHGEGLKPYVHKGYHYGREKGARAKYIFSVKESGKYEVRVNWQPHENRGTSVPVSVQSAEGAKTATLNQKEKAGLDKGFHSLGTFTFNAGEEASVIIGTENSGGNVHLDAVQILPAK